MIGSVSGQFRAFSWRSTSDVPGSWNKTKKRKLRAFAIDESSFIPILC